MEFSLSYCVWKSLLSVYFIPDQVKEKVREHFVYGPKRNYLHIFLSLNTHAHLILNVKVTYTMVIPNDIRM